MTFVLFNTETGQKIKDYITESEARTALRQCNADAGWTKMGFSWSEGIEREWCKKGETDGYPPYGITEWNRWIEKFSPQVLRNQRYST
jgi:hypothetical protein